MENTIQCSSQSTAGKPVKVQTTVQLPMYNCKIVMSVVDNVRQETVKLYKKYKIKEEMDDDELEGVLVMPSIEVYYLMVSHQFLTHNTIAHEIFHAAVRITEHRGITDEEAQAWLAGHLTGQLYKFLDKKKLTIKHG